MLKSKHFFLVTLLLLTFNNVFSQFNDSKEYGFKGELKKVTTYNYVDIKKQNDKWIIDDKKLVSIWEFIVDENQNFSEVKTTYLANGAKEVQVYKYEFNNNLKRSYKKYDEDGNVIETAKFEWLNEKSYIATFNFNDYIIENKIILNDSYRDFIGENKVFEIYENEKIPIEITSYKNYFDNNNLPLKTEKFDFLGNITTSIINDIQKLDKKGNMIEFAIIKEDGTLERFVKREFEYLD